MNQQKILDPFSKATQEVFKLMLDLDAACDASAKCDVLDDKITIAIGLTGDFSGKIYYSFPKKTTLEMVKIMSGMEIGEIDDFVTSAMGEIANIISGNALIALTEQQITCDILPPEIIAGDFSPLPKEAKAFPALNAGIRTAIGDIDLSIRLVAD